MQPATGWTLWVKNAAVRGARYDFIKHVDSQLLVAEFILRWVAELKLDCHPSLVDLRLVKCGPDRLTKDPAERKAAEEAATVLHPEDTLAEAGVADGSWLVAVTLSTGESGQPTCCPPRAAPDSAATQLTSTSRAPCATQSGAWQRRKTS